MIYIAYGSNLNLEQMKRRCPDSIYLGNAIFPSHSLAYKGHDTGFLTVEKNSDYNIEVGLFLISKKDEIKLDRYEGYPHFYDKKYTYIKNDDNMFLATYYEINEDLDYKVPSLNYLDIVTKGYNNCNISKQQLKDALQYTLDKLKGKTYGKHI